jgi:pimeloyl-ACP methyl ester carboxylesterase/ketosteroid isomerase-like protein
MHTRVTAALLLGLVWVGARPASAQQMPAAVVADPPADKQHPPGLAILIVPSHGVELDAWLYVASGAGPHGTVILAHGLPGYESSGDLAQSIRRARWNVLFFHYRGTWGVPGAFSQSSAIEDTTEVVRFLREPANVEKYHIDPKQLVIIGHSFGGFIAGYTASHDPDIEAVAMIAAVNLGRINADPKEREARLKRWETQLHPVRGATAAGLFAEAERHAKDWDYVQWAEALYGRPVLLVEADDQNRTDMEALASALRQKGAVALEQNEVATDHSFSDHRIALQSIALRWLEKLTANDLTSVSPKAEAVSTESEVRDVLAKFIYAFDNLDWERFRGAFDDDATVFYPRAVPERANGRTEFEKAFRTVFQQIRGEKRMPPYMDIQPKDLRIQVFGSTAVAIFHLDDRAGFLNRRTIVLNKTSVPTAQGRCGRRNASKRDWIAIFRKIRNRERPQMSTSSMQSCTVSAGPMVPVTIPDFGSRIDSNSCLTFLEGYPHAPKGR